jgi:hypothetical protein
MNIKLINCITSYSTYYYKKVQIHISFVILDRIKILMSFVLHTTQIHQYRITTYYFWAFSVCGSRITLIVSLTNKKVA